MKAFPHNLILGILVFNGGWVNISTYSVKLPGNSDKKLKMKVFSSQGLMVLF